MAISFSDFDEIGNADVKNFGAFTPTCAPPTCFIGSYVPVTPAGQMGPFLVDTYYLQDDRHRELAGPVKVRGSN